MSYLTRQPGTRCMPPSKIVAHANVSLSIRPACVSTERIHVQKVIIDHASLPSTANMSPRIGIIWYNRERRTNVTRPESA